MLGKTGPVAAATGVLTSPAGRAVLNSAGPLLGKFVGWMARETSSGIDRILRCFGKVGNKATDNLFAGVVSFGGRVASVAAPVVHRVTRLSDPSTKQARVLSGICRSYVIYKLLKGWVSISCSAWRSSLCLSMRPYSNSMPMRRAALARLGDSTGPTLGVHQPPRSRATAPSQALRAARSAAPRPRATGSQNPGAASVDGGGRFGQPASPGHRPRDAQS